MENVLVELVDTLPELIVLSAIAWFLFQNRRLLKRVLHSINGRILAGAPVKIGNIIDFGQAPAASNPAIPKDAISAADWTPDGGKLLPGLDEDSTFFSKKRQYYLDTYRNFYIIHGAHPTLHFVTDDKGVARRIYNINIYIIAYFDQSLAKVESVDYYFGEGWANRIFRISDRYNGFAIKTIANGEFECIARLNLVPGTITGEDGEPLKSIVLFKFIDLQMPSLG